MSDYRIKITIQNANILRAMNKKGVKSVSELCRLTNTGQSTIGDILNLKKSPVLLNGDWNSSVLKICEFLNVMPSVLFSNEQTTLLFSSMNIHSNFGVDDTKSNFSISTAESEDDSISKISVS